jgi:D-aminoacyl-tRNA deacylase
VIAVVQRVSEASVRVAASGYLASVGRGVCVLLGVEQGDGDAEAAWMASKIARLRIFPDDAGRMNRSVQEVGGAALVVSQFTLAGDCNQGTRPSFTQAADPETGRRHYEAVAASLRREHGVPVETGIFGASMQVSLVNDGPVTLILRRLSSQA